MDEEATTSWIWRTKFKQAFCIYLNPANMASVPVSVQEQRSPWMKSSMPSSSSSSSQTCLSAPSDAKAVKNQAMSSNSFKDSRLDQKRSLTLLQRSKTEIKSIRKIFSNNKLKGSKSKSSWPAKYFDHTGVKVTAMEATDEWTADLTKLLIGHKFARGAHSQLHHGLYKEQTVAVKIITVPDDDENGDIAASLEVEFTREVYLLSKIRHQNVIKLIAACRKDSGFLVVMEYLSGGSLRAFLHKLELEHETLPLQKIISVALDIARGMEFIHSKGVIHRDLKPENILIDEKFCMKIADFGIACEEAYCDALAGDQGTYRWMAPEIYKQKSYGKKVDVYSFGLILWEMISGSIPYNNMAPLPAANAVANKNLRPDIAVDCPPAMKVLIEQCWSSHPRKRPEFWQIVKVLEKFQTSLSDDGTLILVRNPICNKKGFLHWIRKLVSVHSHTNSSSVTKLS